MSLQKWIHTYWVSFSYVGLAIGGLFFAVSLTPSLLPRHYLVQGLLSGLALGVGYAVGLLLVWLWNLLELPQPSQRVERVGKRLTTVLVLLVAVLYLWRATIWQNSIRELMEMDSVASAYPSYVAVIAVLIGALVVSCARLLYRFCLFFYKQIHRFLPQRLSYFVSAILVAVILFTLFNHLVVQQALKVADAVFLRIDRMVDEGMQQPDHPMATGSAQSLVSWDSIGLQGKVFVLEGPSEEDLKEFHNGNAIRPVRVYVGLDCGETPEDRARLALDELKRAGGFDRAVLVVATPTGTGWLDPGAVDTLEYLHHGDTAIVSMQYSYLPSWITILIDPNRSRDAARTLFDEIYMHWKSLPADQRPKLYLHGLSLGALGSEICADLFTLFADPIQGGLWSGPPFPSTGWASATRSRNHDSPAWLPRYRDGSMLRFTGRECSLQEFGDTWGMMRFVYLQHASDPMTFFSPNLLYQSPAWLQEGRGPDVSPYLGWYPIVTFLQIAFDLPMATSVPSGYGHNYNAASYIDAWIQVTDPQDWDEEDTRRLKEVFAENQ